MKTFLIGMSTLIIGSSVSAMTQNTLRFRGKNKPETLKTYLDLQAVNYNCQKNTDLLRSVQQETIVMSLFCGILKCGLQAKQCIEACRPDCHSCE